MIEAIVDGCSIKLSSPKTARQILDILRLHPYDESTEVYSFINKVLEERNEDNKNSRDVLNGRNLQENVFPSILIPGYGKIRSQETIWFHVHLDEIAIENDGDEVFISRRVAR